MKRLKTFEQYYMVNEKITLKNILFYLSLFYIGHYGIDYYKGYSGIKHFYNEVNSQINIPVGEDKIKIEEIRDNTISQIENSDLFNEYNKKMIIDSLKTIDIHFITVRKNDIIKESIAAMFIQMDSLTENLHKDYLFKYIDLESNYNNIILINSNYKDDKDLPEMLTHEIYHYVDALLDKLSQKIDFTEFIDNNITKEDNKRYLIDKTSRIFSLNKSKINKNKDLQNIIIALTSSITKDINYLSKNEEIFARWKTFKSKLQKYGYIQHISDKINTNIIYEYMDSEYKNELDLELLLILDLNKIEKLDNLII